MSHDHDHDHHHDHDHDHDGHHIPHHHQDDDHHRPHPMTRRHLILAGGAGLGAVLLAACGTKDIRATDGTPTSAENAVATGPTTTTTLAALTTLPGFEAFASTVRVVAEGDWWLVESNGLPAHSMMTGITSWQQQVPTPQPYTGANAFRIPRTPRIAATPVSARTSLYRGAIALAVNGVPIFNALNNRGDDAYLAGELDRWGGHSGRADDYHYHVAPFHLQSAVGAGVPIAYALDGYAIYGEAEPEGGPVGKLDEFNGHVGANGVYHYHGTRTYPYINGGLRGEVTVQNDQIEPQPTTKAFRPSLTGLRGAVITGFDAPTNGAYRLDYTLNGAAARVEYTVEASAVSFVFTGTDGSVRRETYRR